MSTTVRKRIKKYVGQYMTEEDLTDAFSSAPNHPMWQAIMLYAEAFREACVDIATDPSLTEKESYMTMGGIAVMDDWVAMLNNRAGIALSRKEILQQQKAIAQQEAALKAQQIAEAKLAAQRKSDAEAAATAKREAAARNKNVRQNEQNEQNGEGTQDDSDTEK